MLSFSFPWAKYRSILVTGMGGGCDVFTAHTLALYLRALPKVKAGTTKVTFGNCIGFRKSLSQHERVAECLYRVRVGQPLEKGKQYWGETGLEESLYDEKDSEFGPVLSVILHKSVAPSLPEVADVTRANSNGLLEAWVGRFDLIVAVDNGGDSLTGGIDFRDHIELGRDTQVSLALRQFQASGAGEFLHVVMGPGCDGESSARALADARQKLIESGQFVGEFDLSALLEDTYARTAILGGTRTPNIMYNASKLLQSNSLEASEGASIEVPRGHSPHHIIPVKWLCTAWVSQEAPYCTDLKCYERSPCPIHNAGCVKAKPTAKI